LAWRLIGPIGALATDQHPPGSGKISSTALWRIRVGDVRVIYEIAADQRTVFVVRIARRSERTYRRIT